MPIYRASLLAPRDDWRTTTLGEVAEIFDGRTQRRTKTDIGAQVPEYPFAEERALRSDEVVLISVMTSFSTWTRRVAHPVAADTMFSYETRIGQAAHWDRDEPAALGRRMRLFVRVQPQFNPRFLTLAYLGPQFHKSIEAQEPSTAQRWTGSQLQTWQPGRFQSRLSLDEQERIVGSLDKFDALVNDLSIGLPAELNARRKQYEYYRDRLLTFEELRHERGASAPRYEPIAVSAREHGRRRVRSRTDQARRRTSREAELEARVHQAPAVAGVRVPARSRARPQLVANLRTQLEALNGIEFSDAEWERFFTEKIAGANEGIVEKTVRIQEDHVQVLKRDDGTTKNITLIDKTQHPQQPAAGHQPVRGRPGRGRRKRANRYDVTVLVNGLPLVHVELKRRGVDIREAFNQINRYQRDSFWAGSGLFEYVQLFVISNGTLTKYYSQHDPRSAPQPSRPAGEAGGKTSNSFEFTSLVGGRRRTSRSRT